MKFEFSAGGVVCKKTGKQIFILVAQHSGHHGWVFPKGHIDRPETKEEAALREVKEETGVIGEILKPLSPVTYWFVQDKEKIKKTVYYFFMNFVQGDTNERDQEMEAVEWISVENVEKTLTYPSDKKAWKEAQTLL